MGGGSSIIGADPARRWIKVSSTSQVAGSLADSFERSTTDEEKLNIYIKIVRLFLEVIHGVSINGDLQSAD